MKNLFNNIFYCFLFVASIVFYSSTSVYADICSNPKSGWLFCDDFENGNLSSTGWYYNSPSMTYFPSPPAPSASITNTESFSGSKSMMAIYQPGDAGAAARAHHNFTPSKQVYVRYYRLFEKNWIFNPNRQMHSTYLFAGNYVSPTTTDLTIYEDNNGNTRKTNLTVKSTYQNNLTVPAGTSYVLNSYPVMPHNVASPVAITPGKWVCIEYMTKLNTAGKQDGEIKLWVDGTLVTDLQNLVLRDSSHANILIDHFLFGPNYPPSGPTQVQRNYIDALVISTSRIGTLNPDGKIITPSSNITIGVGQSIDFSASVTDPNGDPNISYLWDFDGGATNKTVKDPIGVVFNTVGTYTVTFTPTNSLGISDNTPATVTVSVVTTVPAPTNFHKVSPP